MGIKVKPLERDNQSIDLVNKYFPNKHISVWPKFSSHIGYSFVVDVSKTKMGM